MLQDEPLLDGSDGSAKGPGRPRPRSTGMMDRRTRTVGVCNFTRFVGQWSSRRTRHEFSAHLFRLLSAHSSVLGPLRNCHQTGQTGRETRRTIAKSTLSYRREAVKHWHYAYLPGYGKRGRELYSGLLTCTASSFLKRKVRSNPAHPGKLPRKVDPFIAPRIVQ